MGEGGHCDVLAIYWLSGIAQVMSREFGGKMGWSSKMGGGGCRSV